MRHTTNSFSQNPEHIKDSNHEENLIELSHYIWDKLYEELFEEEILNNDNMEYPCGYNQKTFKEEIEGLKKRLMILGE